MPIFGTQHDEEPEIFHVCSTMSVAVHIREKMSTQAKLHFLNQKSCNFDSISRYSYKLFRMVSHQRAV
jgi:hypothetical protein